MQFNPGDGTGIIDEIDFICGTDSTGYPTADKTRSINRWHRKAIQRARKASKGWRFDDKNHTTLDVATTTLVAGQAQYTLDATMYAIEAVEVLDADGNWHRVNLLDRRDIKGSITDYLTEDGLPSEAYLTGDSIILEPAPAAADVTVASGLKLYVGREADTFTTADTTQEPAIAEPYHPILSWGASYDFWTVHAQLEQAQTARAEIEMYMTEMESFYGMRNDDMKARIIPRHRTENYE